LNNHNFRGNNDTGSTPLPGGEDEHDHGAETAGRLVFTHADGSNSRVYVHDLESRSTLADFALVHPATAVHSSPEHRYAVIVQRDNDQVEFLDGGVYRHDDHVDEGDPAMLPFTLSGVRPTHYRHHGEQADLFFVNGGDGTFAELGAARGVADFDAPAGLRFQPTQTSLSGDELSVATVSPSRLLAADDNEYRAARAVADELSQSRLAQPAATVASGASSQKEVRDNLLEELAVATGLVRSNAQAAASPVATARPGLDTLVAADPAAQQSLVEMLTRVLIGPDQLELAGSAPLADLIAPLISAYNEIADEPIIAATADRYRDARLNFTAFNLPESLAQLMDFLQAIE
jgi:hypothetical protein